MGNEIGSIKAELDQDGYFPGEEVRGDLILHITEPEKCGELEMLVEGAEHFQMKQKKLTLSFSKPFLIDKATISETWLKYPKGRYVFPFKYPLRADLPGSMETVGCGAQSNTSMGLRYTITASMKTKFPLNRDFKTTKELVVYSRAVDHVQRPLEVSTSQEKHSPFGAIGFCHLSAAINRSSQAVGGLVSVRWTVSNQSSEAVDSVSVSLRRVVTFKAGNQIPVNGSGSHNARSHHFRGVREHKTLEDATELTLARQNPALPLYPSAKTNSMTSEYFVVVTCHFTLHKNVAVELPIEVFASSTEDSEAKTEGENGVDLDVGAVISAVGILVGQLADGN